MAKNKVFSFFSGSGFLDLGFEKKKFEVVFVNENNQSFLDAYKHSRKILRSVKPRFGFSSLNIEDYLDSELPSARLARHVSDARSDGSLVGFIGGPPCPDFSLAGKHKGFEGENGRLTRVYYNLIIEQKPDWFLFENVKGLFSTKKHREFFDELLTDMRKAGYAVCYNILNSLEFGVPQYRERVIVFGVKKSLVGDNFIKPAASDEERYIRYSEFKNFDARQHAKYKMEKITKLKWPATSQFSKNNKIVCPKGIPQELTVEHWLKKNKTGKHPNRNHHFNPTKGNKRFSEVEEGCVGKKSFKRLHRWRYSPTAAYGNNEVHLHPYKTRRLSAAEALAIQSMPKGFELPPDMPLTNMFKTIGNGVPFLMAKGIAHSISSYLAYLEKAAKKRAPAKRQMRRSG